LFFKKIHFYFITGLFSLTESSLRIRKNNPDDWIMNYNIVLEAKQNLFFLLKKWLSAETGWGGDAQTGRDSDEVQFLIPIEYGKDIR